MRPFSRSLFRPRRDLDELGKLFFGQRRIDELELDRVPLNPRHVLHLVRLQCLFRLKFLDRVCDQVRIELHLLGIHRNRLGIRIHPIDGLAIALDEPHDRVPLALQRFGVDDDRSHRLPAQRRCIAAADEDADLSFLELLHAEWRCGPADIDLPGHDLGQRGGRPAGRRWLGLDAKLVDECQHEIVRARTAGGIGIVLLAVMSPTVLSGDSVFTYQNRSPVPVNAGSRMRSGAPRANARMTPATPTPAPRSALPAMTGCMVSPAPCVPTFSSARLCRLKMPASWPSVGAWFSQLLIWPIATLS